MRRNLAPTALVMATMILAANPASAFLAQNSLVVEGDGPGTFSVLNKPGTMSPSDLWCAAGDYALRALNLAPTNRLWRLSPPPRRGGESVRFSTSPEGAAPRTGLLMLGDTGSVSVAFAEALCWDQTPRR